MTVTPTPTSVAVLTDMLLSRTFLSFPSHWRSLEAGRSRRAERHSGGRLLSPPG